MDKTEEKNVLSFNMEKMKKMDKTEEKTNKTET